MQRSTGKCRVDFRRRLGGGVIGMRCTVVHPEPSPHFDCWSRARPKLRELGVSLLLLEVFFREAILTGMLRRKLKNEARLCVEKKR